MIRFRVSFGSKLHIMRAMCVLESLKSETAEPYNVVSVCEIKNHMASSLFCLKTVIFVSDHKSGLLYGRFYRSISNVFRKDKRAYHKFGADVGKIFKNFKADPTKRQWSLTLRILYGLRDITISTTLALLQISGFKVTQARRKESKYKGLKQDDLNVQFSKL